MIFSSCFNSSASSILYVFAISWIVSETLFNLSAVSLLLFNALSGNTGKSFEPPVNSSIFILIDFGTAKSPIDAINISLKWINSTVYPFDTYASTTFPKQNPTITPIFPNLFNIPAIIPEIAYAATIIGSDDVITPNVTPIVTPAVVPTNTPFFHPKIKTIRILKIFWTENPNIFIPLNALTEIDNNKLAPNTSSIENALFSLKSWITESEFTNIL